MPLRFPYWQRTLVMVVCICGLAWAVSIGDDLASYGAALLFASSGAFVAFALLRHIDRLAGCLEKTRDELSVLREQLTGGTAQPPAAEGETG